MPVEETPNLIPYWEYCYERTLGCIGILKNWLTRALKDALDEGTNTGVHPSLDMSKNTQ